MNSKIITKMNVVDNEVRVMSINGEDFISLTDIARFKNDDRPSEVITNIDTNGDAVAGSNEDMGTNQGGSEYDSMAE